jgi:flagellar hook-associated protein 2
LSIQVGSGTAETIQIGAAPSSPRSNTIYTGSGVNTLAGLAAAITTANIGVTAGVSTSDGESSLTLTSQTAGANGALTVTPSLTVTAQSTLTYESAGYTSTTPDTGTFGTVGGSGDTLSGSMTIQVGSGSVQTITLDSSDDTLSGLMGAINGLTGVTAAPNSAGTALTLTSGSNGSAGALTITSNIVDPTGTISTPNYNPSSDINNLTSLGISVNNDGSLTFDATSLDSVLNTDYGGVVGFFQNASSWGQSFSNMLTNAGSSNSTGILALASSSDSSTESTLNAEISKENSLISVEQSSLTTELNSANEVMEELPTQLEGVNELYSAITGYDQNPGG